MFIVFGRDISLVLWTREISLLKNNSHDLHWVITHSLVLVILCCTMACFHMISISLISGGDHPVLTTFYGHYPCVHYFNVPCLIMTSQWVMTLLGMSHCRTTMGNNIARDIHYDVTMENDVAGITMDNDIAMNLFCYVSLHQIMILLFHQ